MPGIKTPDVLGQVINDQNKAVLKVKKLIPDAVVPTHGSAEAAGFDLYATEDMRIDNQQSVMVHTGIAVEIPKGYMGLIFARSGIASKKHLRPSNCVGVVDSDYRGEVLVNLYNDSHHNMIGYQEITKGERIAQLVITPYIAPPIVEITEMTETERGEGGFGSSDEK